MHENVEKDRQCKANAAGDHAGFDFVVTGDLRRDASPVLQLLFASFALLGEEGHLSKPWLPPGNFLASLALVNRLAYGVQIRAARFAEFQLLAFPGTTSRAKHNTLP